MIVTLYIPDDSLPAFERFLEVFQDVTTDANGRFVNTPRYTGPEDYIRKQVDEIVRHIQANS